MKNIQVDNTLINDGLEEINKVLDWYKISGWIVQCLECGTWLTNLGLCPECGIRYELVEQTKVIDRDSFCRIQKHVYVEGICAECGHKEDQAIEHQMQRTVCTACKTELTESNVYCPTCGLWNPNNRR